MEEHEKSSPIQGTPGSDTKKSSSKMALNFHHFDLLVLTLVMFVLVSRPRSPHSELLKKSERIMNFV